MAANDDPDPNPNPFDAKSKGYALTTNLLFTITLVLFFLLLLLLISLHFYSRWYLRRARLRLRQRRRSYLVFYVDSDSPPPVGLDPSVIHSLPVFVYSAHSDPVECAVCLSDFQENESGRVLPKCNHTFHVDCIDMWFHSHSTCPLCRSLVEPVPSGDRPGPEVVIDVCGPGSSSGCRQDGEEENRTGRTLCSSSSSIGLRRKPSSLGVAIDVPSNRSFGREAEASTTSFRSPGGRLLSFKRILSIRDRKPSPPSPSSETCAVGCSSMTGTETSQ